ncbi:MAG: methyltransferase domain-containing protein [Bryobacteraceae bacterium]
MRAGALALRSFRGVLHQIDIKLTKWLASVPGAAHPDDANELPFRNFFHELETDEAARDYLEVHMPRLMRTMSLAPRPAGADRALELGSYLHMAAALHALHHYPEVRAANFGLLGQSVPKSVVFPGGTFECSVDLFDVEQDRFPYPDRYFSLVLCCEILEHLVRDPMHMMLEIHRILSPGGTLLLTTPNCAGLTCVANLLEGRVNPQVYSRYSRSQPDDRPHVREYTAYEVAALMESSGFEIRQLTTDRIESRDAAVWVYELLRRNHLDTAHRGEQVYCLAVARPESPKNRYPAWLYD